MGRGDENKRKRKRAAESCETIRKYFSKREDVIKSEEDSEPDSAHPNDEIEEHEEENVENKASSENGIFLIYIILD